MDKNSIITLDIWHVLRAQYAYGRTAARAIELLEILGLPRLRSRTVR